jgi:methylmalonyl-CoA/ethylmalonyl-CoA epimerase
VEDIDAAIDLYNGKFDMREQRRETVEEQDVEAVLLEIGEGHVELIRPLSEESGVAKWLAKNGPGVHHVAYQTDDIDTALEAVREAGMRLIDEEPRVGIGGARVAFIHPKATGGVLTELVEPTH